MQSIVTIIVFLLLSLILGAITTTFVSLAEDKKGKDFNIKEYIYYFKDFRLDLKYVIIFFILYLLVVKTANIVNVVIYSPVLLSLMLGFILDTKFMIIPDTSSVLMLFSGIVNLVINFSKEALLSSFLGLIVGFLLLFIPDYIFRMIVKKDGFGMGDMKLLASIGIFMGLKSVLVIFVISIVLSSICGVAIIIYKKINENKDKKNKENIKEMYIPFGPYIIVSTLIVLIIPAIIFTSITNYLVRIIVKKMI
jgi:prepilin signal peptidase PulO-like enzyme (type II secretory pathway)